MGQLIMDNFVSGALSSIFKLFNRHAFNYANSVIVLQVWDGKIIHYSL